MVFDPQHEEEDNGEGGGGKVEAAQLRCSMEIRRIAFLLRARQLLQLLCRLRKNRTLETTGWDGPKMARVGNKDMVRIEEEDEEY